MWEVQPNCANGHIYEDSLHSPSHVLLDSPCAALHCSCMHMLWHSTLHGELRLSIGGSVAAEGLEVCDVTQGFPQTSHQCFMTPATNDRLTAGSVVGSTGEWWDAAGEADRKWEMGVAALKEGRGRGAHGSRVKKREKVALRQCKAGTENHFWGVFRLLPAARHAIRSLGAIAHAFLIYLYKFFALSGCHGRVPRRLVGGLIVINTLR